MSSDIIVFETLSREPNAITTFIDDMGKAFAGGGLAGVQSPGHGKMIALQMLAERMTPSQFVAKYHIMDGGKLQHQATWVAAEMERRGWRLKWVKTGTDGKEAILRCTHENKGQHDVPYTIEMAQKAGIVKDGGGWQKNPDKMLRARCRTDAAVMLEPSIVSGHDDDFTAFESSPEPAAGPSLEPSPVQPDESEITEAEFSYTHAEPSQEEYLKAKGEQLEGVAADCQEPAEQAIIEEVRSLVAQRQCNEVAAEILTEQFGGRPVQELNVVDARAFLIRLYVALLGWQSKLGKSCQRYGVDSPSLLTRGQSDGMLANLRKALAK